MNSNSIQIHIRQLPGIRNVFISARMVFLGSKFRVTLWHTSIIYWKTFWDKHVRKNHKLQVWFLQNFLLSEDVTSTNLVRIAKIFRGNCFLVQGSFSEACPQAQIEKKEIHPKKSTQNKKIHLNKFFWIISIGFLTHVTAGRSLGQKTTPSSHGNVFPAGQFLNYPAKLFVNCLGSNFRIQWYLASGNRQQLAITTSW